jgi:hypothetical protein
LSNNPNRKKMAEEKSFTHEHGVLTYHELTLKDRIPRTHIVPGNAETLQIGPFKRVYRCIIPGENSGITTPMGWKVIQTRIDDYGKESEPVEWTYLWMHAPSEHGIYNPLLFGSNLEYRASLDVDVSDLTYMWGFCTREDSDTSSVHNAIWFDENVMAKLYRRPHLLGKEDYIELMKIHLGVMSGEDKKRGDASILPVEQKISGLEKSLEHLQGFVSAAHNFEDDLTYGKWLRRKPVDQLVEDYQKTIGKLVRNARG